MGQTQSQAPPPVYTTSAPAVITVPATSANIQSPPVQQQYNVATGVASNGVFNNAYASSGVLVDVTNLKNCMSLSPSDAYSLGNCATTYIKGINQNNNSIINLTTGQTINTFDNIENFENSEIFNNNTFTNTIVVLFILFLILILCKK